MDGETVRLDFPGYFTERNRNGSLRHRVRVKGHKAIKITLPCGPDSPDFHRQYIAARAGIKPDTSQPDITPNAGTVGWLCTAYIAHLTRMAAQGTGSQLTLKQRKPMAERLMAHKSSSGRSKGRAYRDLPMMIPTGELLAYRDSLMQTPGQAKNTFKFIKAMYDWAHQRGHCDHNPAASIKVAYKSQGGATAWTVDDLKAFRKAHPEGTMAHTALTLFMFTACRIQCATILGRQHEYQREGTPWLHWTPRKRGSRTVDIPILPPLERALRSQKIIGRTYLLTGYGQPYASPEGLRNRMAKWCAAAGLKDRSSHGIRKAAGHLLAIHGATQYEIMAVHGHANASTSQVYTNDVERVQLAQRAVTRLSGMDW